VTGIYALPLLGWEVKEGDVALCPEHHSGSQSFIDHQLSGAVVTFHLLDMCDSTNKYFDAEVLQFISKKLEDKMKRQKADMEKAAAEIKPAEDN
jgi:hypothetical protein